MEALLTFALVFMVRTSLLMHFVYITYDYHIMLPFKMRHPLQKNGYKKVRQGTNRGNLLNCESYR